jgi:hypothetical protein
MYLVGRALFHIPRSGLGALALVMGLAVADPAWAIALVGNTQTVVRQVAGITETEEQTLYVDSEVFQNEEIVTRAHSATRIIFKDGTNLEMGENSRLRLTKLVFDPDPAKSKVAVKALVGVFRWTSGTLPHSSYEIASPAATIGIRGTTLEWVVGDSGLTTVALSRGSIVVTNHKGKSVTLKPNEATTVQPPDRNGNQADPSEPGPLSPELAALLWNMTVMIRMSEPGDIAPTGGGGGTTAQTAPKKGDNSQSTSDDTPKAPGFPAPFTTPFRFTSFAPPVVPQPTTTSPTIIVTPPQPPIILGTIKFLGEHKAELILTSGANGSLVFKTVQIVNDPKHAFSIDGSVFGNAIDLSSESLLDTLLALLEFEPPKGQKGPFDGELLFTDKNGNGFEFELAGTPINVAEPSSIALLGIGLGGMWWMRRRRKAG